MGIMFTIWVNKINSYTTFIKVGLRGSIRISNYLFFDEFESSSKVWILFCFSNAAKAFLYKILEIFVGETAPLMILKDLYWILYILPFAE